jgi:hypothetical protein
MGPQQLEAWFVPYCRRSAACIFSQLTVVPVILCLLICSLPAEAKPLPSMSAEAVHSLVEKLGVGEPITGRVSSSGPGPVQYTDISGKIAAVSDKSFDLSVKKGRKVLVQTYAYGNVDEIHGTRVDYKYIVVATVVTAAVFIALVIRDRTTTR